MGKVFQSYLENLSLGDLQEHEDMAVFPLVLEKEAKTPYILLDEALQEGLLTITEKVEGGRVPELLVINKADQEVLILDGEELVGAKQNRIVNTSILLERFSRTIIPVSCVEEGRWRYKARAFSSGRKVFSGAGRAMKMKSVHRSLREEGLPLSDQGAVWNHIGEVACRLHAHSPTGAWSDIYESVSDRVDSLLKGFKTVPGQVGMLVAINGRVVGCDSFGKAETLEKVFPKLIRSYAIDALYPDDNGRRIDRLEVQAQTFMSQIGEASKLPYTSPGLGTDLRMENEDAIGAALVFGDEVVHFSAFTRGRYEHL